MTVPVQFTFRHFDPGAELIEYLTHQINKLRGERFHLTQCQVRVSGNQHHLQGGPYKISIEVRFRGRQIQVYQSGDDPFAVVRTGFDALRRRFERRQKRRRVSTWRSLQSASAVMIANPILEGAPPPSLEHIS